MTRYVAVCICLLFALAIPEVVQAQADGPAFSNRRSPVVTSPQSVRTTFSGSSSASHTVRIRIRPHARLVSGGTHVVRDNATGVERTVEAVRLYSNIRNTKVVESGAEATIGNDLRQQPGEVLYASSTIGSASGVGTDQDQPGRVFLIGTETGDVTRYVTVTEM